MDNTISFEEGMAQLEQIVEKLENGETTLEESFSQYEKGMQLYKQLKSILEEGEAKIIQLTKNEEKEDLPNA